MAESNSALGQIIGRHLDIYLIADQNADAELTHLAGGACDDFVVVLEFHPEHRVGQLFRDGARKLQQFFFGHFAFYQFIEIAPSQSGLRAHYRAAESFLSSQRHV